MMQPRQPMAKLIQQGKKAVTDGVSRNGSVQIAGVDPPVRHALLVKPGHDLHPVDIQQGAYDRYSVHHPPMAQPRQPTGIGAAQQTQQQRLQLVVAMMAQRHDPIRMLDQMPPPPGEAQPARRHFDTLSSLLFGNDIEMRLAKLDLPFFTEALAPVEVPISLTPPQVMVKVNRHQRIAELMQRQKQCRAVRPPAETNQHTRGIIQKTMLLDSLCHTDQKRCVCSSHGAAEKVFIMHVHGDAILQNMALLRSMVNTRPLFFVLPASLPPWARHSPEWHLR